MWASFRDQIDFMDAVFGAKVKKTYPSRCLGLDTYLGGDEGIEYPPSKLGASVNIVGVQTGYGCCQTGVGELALDAFYDQALPAVAGPRW